MDHLKKEIFNETTEETIRHLINLNYINDGRFALSWVKTRAKDKNFGKHRLFMELTAKWIPIYLAEQTARKVFSEFSEWELARSCAEKKSVSRQS